MMQWKRVAASLFAFALLISISTAFARQAVVTTRDGQRFEGDVTENENEVVIDIKGVKTVIPRANVANVVYPESFDKQFRDRLAALDPKDVRGRIDLARWALDQQQYNAARDALDSAMAIDPNNREAFDLQNLVRSQQRLSQPKQQGNEKPSTAASPTTPVPPGAIPAGERRLLNQADVNVIRQRELKPSDTARIQFANQVDQRFIKYANLQQSEFMSLKPVDRALRILKEGDPSMRDDVKIQTDPQSLVEYQRTIQPLIINNCATSNCHGSSRGGNFMIYTPPDSPLVTYTNFYILNKYARKIGQTGGGMFGGAAERRMIDRGQPQNSLLLQYSLPAAVAEYDHPKVQGYDGAFRTKDDLNYRRIATWISDVLTPVAPD
jgi:hypothetical protein